MLAGEKVLGYVDGFRNASCVTAACELDVFTRILALGNNVTTENLARDMACDERALATLLRMLVSLKLLESADGEFFSVPEEFREFLDSRSAKTMVPLVCHWGACMRQWDRIAQTVVSGEPPATLPGVFGPEKDRENFLAAMHVLGKQKAGPIVELLRTQGLAKFTKMLDLGGAFGTYTKEFLRKCPEGCGVIFDLPQAVAEAEKRLADDPLRDRITFVAGDFYRDEFPGGMDWLWISAIIHQQDDAETEKMFAKAYRALVSGGKVGIRDVYFEPNRLGPPAATHFAMNMVVNTRRGKVYTVEEVFSLLTLTGFQNPQLAVRSDDMGSVIVAEKP
ncbi:MAG: methyltransferase [Planctomycetia bacterium]|nr:methyltransferase [Planctomycetia bacterium]